MCRAEYQRLRRTLRENGSYALKWMTPRQRQKMRWLINQPADELADRSTMSRVYAKTSGGLWAGNLLKVKAVPA